MTVTIDPEALSRLREIGGTWAVYQNSALDSATRGHLQFLRFGPEDGLTFKEPPPSGASVVGLDWKYLLIGTFDSTQIPDTGIVSLGDKP